MYLKESISTAFIVNLVLIFTGVFIALYVGSLAFTKGFKIRNRILDILDEHGGYTELAAIEIDENLSAIGYRLIENPNCNKVSDKNVLLESQSDYGYCVYRYDDVKGTYYGVTTFVTLDIPIIGNMIEIPLYGETRLLLDLDGVDKR